MNNGDNVTRGRHLEALAGVFLGRLTSVSGAIDDILNSFGVFTGATSVRAGTEGLVPAPAAGDEVKFLCGDGTWSTVESGATVLDTIPATVNGGMWYEVVNGTPIVKIYYNGQEYSITGSANDPNLTVGLTTSSTVTVLQPATANLSYDGDGEISLSASNANVTPTYNSSTRTLTVPYANPEVTGDVTLYVDIGAGTNHYATREQFNVTMQKLSPNLTVTPTTPTTIPEGGNYTANVTFDGGGTITISNSNANVTATYSNGTLTIPYAAGAGSATITLSLSASYGYTSDTATVTVTMAKASPQLTLAQHEVINIYGETTYPYPFDSMILPVDEEAHARITRLGSGAITTSVTSTYPAANVTAEYDAGVLIVSHGLTVTFANFQDIPFPFTATVTVSVAETADYAAETKTHTVTFNSPLAVNMPFNSSVTQDLAGNTWTTVGSPTIAPVPNTDQTALYVNADSYLVGDVGSRVESINLGQADYTICFELYRPAQTGGIIFWANGGSRIVSQTRGTVAFEPRSFGGKIIYCTPGSSLAHIACVFRHNTGTDTNGYRLSASEIYVNGVLHESYEGLFTDASGTSPFYLGGWKNQDADTAYKFTGYIRNFKIYYGLALAPSEFMS